MTARSLTGHCLCGNVSYRFEGEPIGAALCHCEDCQRQTGTTFSIVLGVPSEGFEIEGETIGTYVTYGKENGAERHRRFCTNCGSPIATLMLDNPAMTVIKAGTLDDRSWLDPQVEIWSENAQPWLEPTEGRPRLPGGLPPQA